MIMRTAALSPSGVVTTYREMSEDTR